MNASVAALLFVGLLLTLLGLFVAGNVVIIALGVVALLAAGVFEAAPGRGRRP